VNNPVYGTTRETTDGNIINAFAVHAG